MLDRNIYRYILRHSKRQQIVLTIMAVVSFPFLYAFYEVPKQIINHISKSSVTKGEGVSKSMVGFEMDAITYLIAMCLIFLALVLINQGFKYVINVYRGLTGERLLRRLRYDLYGRVLRFPQPAFRKVSQGEIIQMINGEVEPLGGFFGEAYSLPIFQGGYLVVILGFVVWQNVWLALAAIMFYPLQFYFIPKLQRRVNLLGKQRVRLVRGLSDRIGESVSGAAEIHAHNTARRELAEFARRLGDIFQVRYQIFLWKFVIKFINNTVNHLGPFFFFSVGGYLVIQGSLEIGTLVAVLAANKDLAAPWKELLNFYQRREDARIKYEQVIEQFEPAGLMEEDQQLSEPEEKISLDHPIAAAGVRLDDETGHTQIDGVTLDVDYGKHVAVVGSGNSGKEHLAALLSRLMVPTGGSIKIGDHKLDDLPEAVTGRRISYVGANAYVFASTIRDNLLYGLQHVPLRAPDYDSETAAEREKWEAEALRAGNSTDDLAADWVDYEAAGVDNADQMTERALAVLDIVDMQEDIYDFGLRGRIDPADDPELADAILGARKAFQKRLDDPDLAPLVEVFDAEKYNDNATVGENLLFGRPVGDAFDLNRLAEHAYVREVLETAGMTGMVLDAGRQVASTMVELFADLPPGHEFFDRYSFIEQEDLPLYQAVLTRIGREGIEALNPDERMLLMSLPFRLSPARHRLDIITDEFRESLMKARQIFAAEIPEDLADSIEQFDQDRYTAAASIQDNILFGKIAYGHARGGDRVRAIIGEVVEESGLKTQIMEVGLGFEVGIAGGRLSSIQRQKLALGRAVIKNPDVLILNEATASLDGAGQARVMRNLLETFKGRSVIWMLHRPSQASLFDQVVVMRAGRVEASGTFDEVNNEGGVLSELINAE